MWNEYYEDCLIYYCGRHCDAEFCWGRRLWEVEPCSEWSMDATTKVNAAAIEWMIRQDGKNCDGWRGHVGLKHPWMFEYVKRVCMLEAQTVYMRGEERWVQYSEENVMFIVMALWFCLGIRATYPPSLLFFSRPTCMTLYISNLKICLKSDRELKSPTKIWIMNKN